MSADTHGGSGRSATAAQGRDVAAIPLATVLWVLVVAALSYGVAQTLSKVVALFS